MAERLAEQPEQFVQAMAQSELGLSEHRFPESMDCRNLGWHLHSDRRFHSRSFHSFSSGGVTAVIVSFGISLVAHFARRRAEITDHHPFLVGIRSWK